MKTKSIFVFGAGSVLEWGAPSTAELTEIVLNSGFKMCDNKTTITTFIFKTLIEQGYSPKDVNFETIISTIEELIVYYSNFDAKNSLPSLLSCFFHSKFDKEILNFTIEGGKEKHGYSLQIPKGVKYNYSKISYQKETPAQFFFEHLLGEILSNVSARIIDYSYHSDNHSKIDLKSESSVSFVEWMKLHALQSSLRIYTLNYDRLFKVLLIENNIKIFEGFETEDLLDTTYHLRPNVNRILSDFESNSFYNLHGSVNWDVEDLDMHELPNAEIFFKKYPNLPANNTPASHQIEKGKTLMITNIITGYQKAQKGMITPYKQMQSAFDRDCCFAENIYIIGYSFGDEHINESLRTALRHNKNLKITIVDPYFMTDNKDVEVGLKLFSATDNMRTLPIKISPHVHLHNGNTFTVHTIGFKEFRENQIALYKEATVVKY